MSSTPGVYIKEVDGLSLSVKSGATAVPVFVGNFEATSAQAKQQKCMPISGWLEFATHYKTVAEVDVLTLEAADLAALDSGNAKGLTELKRKITVQPNWGALTLQHYFQNGGGACYVMPLGSHGDPALWKTEPAMLPAEIEKHPAITLLVCAEPEQEGALDKGQKGEVYAKLVTALTNPKSPGRYFLIGDAEQDTGGETVKVEVPEALKSEKHAAVYYPALKTTLRHVRKDDDELVVAFDVKVDDAEKQYTVGKDSNKAINRLSLLAKANAKGKQARYQALSRLIDATLAEQVVELPPSAAMAGVYASTDRGRGVWKAPANVALNAVTEPTTRVTDDVQGGLNEKGINVIRRFMSGGTVVWGARTQAKEKEWLYVPVRRLFTAAERDIRDALQVAVFEPNSAPTWTTVKTALDAYLTRLWRQGALAGNKAEEAFFVQVGRGITMDDDDIQNGRLIVKVGMAAVRPAEFIILQFTQNVAQG
ncbi:phage tail sheath family protein [Burkholderia sp. Bp9126]|nr:phage tail sheath family protein [Burkholderia sp. Bp9126]